LQRKDEKFSATVLAARDPEKTYEMGPDLNLDLKKPKTIGFKIGVAPPSVTLPLSFGAAAQNAIVLPYVAVSNLIETFEAPKDFGDNVGGPVTMVQATAQAVQNGFWRVVELAGLLSISVGVFNLLPAHPLDGGQMVMAIAEMLRGGRRLSIRAQVIAGGIGLTFVAALVLSVFVVDIRRITGGAKQEAPPPPASAPAKK
jgi:regulator of sigma E protease